MSCDLYEAFGQLTLRGTEAKSKAASLLQFNRRSFLAGSITCAAVAPAAIAAGTARAQTSKVSSPGDDTGPATYVFRGGRVYTQAPGSPWAEAVAVRNKKIIAVGGSGQMEPFIAGTTKNH